MRQSWSDARRDRIARDKAAHEARVQAHRERKAEQEEAMQKEAAQPQKAPASARSGKPSAIVTRGRLRQQRGAIERTMAWIVLLVSFLGSIAAMHGGFAPLIASIVSWQLNQSALISGVLIQIIVTFLEWYYYDRLLIAWGARVVDTALTAIGYGPLFLAPLIVLLYNRGITEPAYTAWAIIILVSLGIAWFPESRLVD